MSDAVVLDAGAATLGEATDSLAEGAGGTVCVSALHNADTHTVLLIAALDKLLLPTLEVPWAGAGAGAGAGVPCQTFPLAEPGEVARWIRSHHDT